MKSKYLHQLIVYLLLGVMAMADPGMLKHAHTGDRLANDIGVTLQCHTIDDDDDVSAYAHVNKKHSLLKIRFRGESSFRKIFQDAGKLVNAAFPSTVTTLPIGKTTHITLFYYVFLFRLTPF